MIYEAFPKYFSDGQYDIPGEFDKDFRILSYTNGVPDIIDGAEWGALACEYLQNKDGSIHFGTETRGYPDPLLQWMLSKDQSYITLFRDNGSCPRLREPGQPLEA
jgi:hypothetical protein